MASDSPSATACPVCSARTWSPLPAVGPSAMASDLRVVPVPLEHDACGFCGLVRGTTVPPVGGWFDARYGLYAHAPGGPDEVARQAAYAGWIRSLTSGTPARILDVGCGNGSLLVALREWAPDAALSGCDLAEAGIAHARAAGLEVWCGSADEIPPERQADLVTSVNVLEHTPDPARFLAALRARVAPDGQAIVICPDGARPGLELLIADHRHSFHRDHLEHLLWQAGLAPQAWSAAPEGLGAFQAVVATPANAPPPGSRAWSRASVAGVDAYLRAWASLDDRLRTRLGDGRPVVAFGAGEAAGLLRAYAPESWSRVSACVVDHPGTARQFGNLPVQALQAAPAGARYLLAVHPRVQERVAERLSREGHEVVAWYDLAPGDR